MREPRRPSIGRYALAGAGVVCVGLGALGAALPGLPATIFFLGALWCFARSSPRLERWLRESRIVRPYRAYIDGGVPLPRRARVAAIVAMWLAVGASLLALGAGGALTLWLAAILVGAAGAGTVVILRIRRGRNRGRPLTEPGPPAAPS